MALFGFGKKKQAPAPQQEKKPETPKVHGPSDQQMIQVNGIWIVNPDYDPNTKKNDVKVTSFSSGKVWSESVEKFLARSPEAKLVELTGKQEDLASYNVGDRCHVEEDEDADGRYNVTCGGSIIGRLPASAVSYAAKVESVPEDLSVIIADIDYDIEKERDVISVYIA